MKSQQNFTQCQVKLAVSQQQTGVLFYLGLADFVIAKEAETSKKHAQIESKILVTGAHVLHGNARSRVANVINKK